MTCRARKRERTLFRVYITLYSMRSVRIRLTVNRGETEREREKEYTWIAITSSVSDWCHAVNQEDRQRRKGARLRFCLAKPRERPRHDDGIAAYRSVRYIKHDRLLRRYRKTGMLSVMLAERGWRRGGDEEGCREIILSYSIFLWNVRDDKSSSSIGKMRRNHVPGPSIGSHLHGPPPHRDRCHTVCLPRFRFNRGERGLARGDFAHPFEWPIMS